MTPVQAIELISLVIGVAYVIMQIGQHKLMWYADIVSCLCAVYVNLCNPRVAWAMVALNVYFIVMAVRGIFTWRSMDARSGGAIHIVRVTGRKWAAAILLLVVSTLAVWMLLCRTDDPMPLVDALTLSFSALGAWFLTDSHLEQWYAWLVADVFGLVLYMSQGNMFLCCLYAIYVLSSAYGIYNWKKHGVYVA